MGDLLTTAKLGLILQFVVPGLIILFVRNQFISNKRPALNEAALNYVVLSLAYQGLVLPITSVLATAPKGALSSPLAWAFLLFVGPGALGLLVGLNARQGWTRKLLGRIGLNVSHPVDSAWDWRFAACDECWVLAVLKDGTKWAGHLGGGSFMSTDRAERDLYIEHVYDLESDNRWSAKGSSVWIAHGELQTLEFWPIMKDADDGK
jgi:hypothetical protein